MSSRSISQPELFRLFPNASKSTLAANFGDPELSQRKDREGAKEEGSSIPASDPKLERRSVAGTLGKGQTQKGHTGRFLVRVTRCSRRLLDEDNLCEKFVLDCCRYAGLVPGDSPAEVRVETTQRKIEKGEAEHATVEIYEL